MAYYLWVDLVASPTQQAKKVTFFLRKTNRASGTNLNRIYLCHCVTDSLKKTLCGYIPGSVQCYYVTSHKLVEATGGELEFKRLDVLLYQAL